MTRFGIVRRAGGALLSLFFATAALAGPADPRTIVWDQLPDSAAQTYEDPFLDLKPSQVTKLSEIARIRQLLKSPNVLASERDSLRGQQRRTEAELAEEGIDADWLISQRWLVAERRAKAVEAGNVSLDRTIVTISGFAIPAPPDALGNEVAYLVPTPGMCSHMPPPNPNQLIKLQLFGAWSPSRMHEKVRVTGELRLSSSSREYWIVDGEVEMNASWQLVVKKATALLSAPVAAGPNSDWGNSFRSKLSELQSKQ